MAGAYSMDLRERVVAAVMSGVPRREVSHQFDVSYSCVNKWVARYQETGSVAPAKMGGYRVPILIGERDFILSCLADKPHITLEELRSCLEKRGYKVCCTTIWHMLQRERMSFKKNTVRN